MNAYKIFFPLLLLSLLLVACNPSPAPAASATAAQPPATAIGLPTAVAPSATPAPSETPLPSPTLTATPLPTDTLTPTPVPTYVKLRGKVTIDQAVCHYGPGAPYLYKYGVYKGSNLEVLRRVEGGNYVEVQAIGGNNPCWVRQDYLEMQGDWLNLEPVDAAEVRLPPSPYYGPPTGVSANRVGDVVTVFWNPLVLRAGDSSEQTPYVVEAWVCQGGQMVFIPVGAYQTVAEVTDEPGCAVPSHGRLVAAEKHGYTQPVEIPWPQADETSSPEGSPTP